MIIKLLDDVMGVQISDGVNVGFVGGVVLLNEGLCKWFEVYFFGMIMDIMMIIQGFVDGSNWVDLVGLLVVGSDLVMVGFLNVVYVCVVMVGIVGFYDVDLEVFRVQKWWVGGVVMQCCCYCGVYYLVLVCFKRLIVEGVIDILGLICVVYVKMQY